MDGPGALRELAAGLVLGGALICAVFAVLALAGAYRVTGVGWSEGIAVGLVFGVVGGSNEETMFRGFLQRLIETRLGSWWALGTISVIFGLLHLTNPGATLSGCLIIALTAARCSGPATCSPGACGWPSGCTHPGTSSRAASSAPTSRGPE